MNEKIRAKNLNSDLGKYGWFIVVSGLLMFFLCTGIRVEAMNIIIPALSSAHGISSVSMYAANNVVSIVTTAVAVIGSWVAKRTGAKKVIVACWAMGAIGCICYGATTTLPMYVAAYSLMNIANTGAINIGLNLMITNWFPTKKDILLGYVTIGANLSTVFFMTYLNVAITSWGYSLSFYVLAGIYAALLLFMAFFLRDNPEDVGAYPDNDVSMTPEKVKALHEKGLRYQQTSPWTVKKLLFTKQTWLIGLSFGIMTMITVGMMMTLVTTLGIKGVDSSFASGLMVAAAIIAMPMSAAWGFFSAKVGTKMSSVVLWLVVFVMLILMLVPGTWTAYPVCVMLAALIGAGSNLPPAIIASVYGRYDFPNALLVIMAMRQIITAFASSIVGIPQSLTGSYVASYVFLLILSAIAFVLLLILDERCIGRNFLDDEIAD